MTNIKKLYKYQNALEDALLKHRAKFDGRTYSSIIRKIYGAKTLKALEKLLTKFNIADLKDISSNNKVITLQNLNDHGILKEYHIN